MPIPIHHNPAEPWRLPFSASFLLRVVGKGLEVPEDGWDARTFARQGRLLINVMVRLARLTQRKAAVVVARRAVKLFRSQINQTIERAMRHMPRERKAVMLDLFLPGQSDVWMRALNEVFQEAAIHATAELVPPIQSVMGQAYDRTARLLGQEADPSVSARLVRESRDIAGRIVGINDTTRDKFRRTIQDAIDTRMTVEETADHLRRTMDDQFQARASTIARTELNNAWTRGSVISFKQSEVITHVSVVGCQAREPGSPQYRGESTCNIEDVPIEDADKLEFHVNHTGTMVPSRFAEP